MWTTESEGHPKKKHVNTHAVRTQLRQTQRWRAGPKLSGEGAHGKGGGIEQKIKNKEKSSCTQTTVW